MFYACTHPELDAHPGCTRSTNSPRCAVRINSTIVKLIPKRRLPSLRTQHHADRSAKGERKHGNMPIIRRWRCHRLSDSGALLPDVNCVPNYSALIAPLSDPASRINSKRETLRTYFTPHRKRQAPEGHYPQYRHRPKQQNKVEVTSSR